MCILFVSKKEKCSGWMTTVLNEHDGILRCTSLRIDTSGWRVIGRACFMCLIICYSLGL